MQKRFLFLTLLILFLAAPEAALGQSTEFTFQGRLLDNSLPPTASYDFEFTLFDAATGGNELGLIAAPGVSVTSGVFSVPLDFGSSFDGGPRFLQIAVRPAGSLDPLTVLNPRQQISSTPYAIRSLNAAAAETAANASQLGGVDAAEYVLDDDERLTNERAPAPGSGNYIQNQSAQTQPLANFDISGTGTANILSAATQFNLGNSRFLSSPGTLNTLVGINNGSAITSGARNTFVGRNTGVNTTTGSTNTFVGSGAGFENITGSQNSFFGYNSGLRVTSGARNSFFGVSTGGANLIGNDNSVFGFESGLFTTGGENSFFGSSSGRSNTTGTRNVFLGFSAGPGTTSGINNSFIGQNAGIGNVTGSHNVALGSGSGFSTGALTFATAIGPGTIVSSNNTIQLGRITQEERVLIPGDLQVNGAIIGNLPTGSASYIQNTTTTQTSSNFNISGTGTANIFSAGTQYNIGSDRVLSVAGSLNVFIGIGAGVAITEGAANTFVGNLAGHSSTAAYNSSFFGNSAGEHNTTGISNSFFGSNAGKYNTNGRRNSFFGTFSGEQNTLGNDNSFFGLNAGAGNTTGSENAYFGRSAGLVNSTSSRNSAFGAYAGRRSEGDANSFFGWYAGEANITGNSNSFFGGSAGLANVSGNNNAFFGRETGMGNTSGSYNAFVGSLAGQLSTVGSFNAFVGAFAGNANTTGFDNSALGAGANVSTGNLTHATAIGAGAIVTVSSRVQLGRSGQDTVSIGTLAAATSTHLCINGTVLASCSSSARYKENIRPFGTGLSIIRDLRPVRFDWIGRDEPDLGLIAEEVEKVDPLLVTYNQDGEVQGVKYDRIGVVLINVVKEQQKQIDALKAIVCELKPGSAACR